MDETYDERMENINTHMDWMIKYLEDVSGEKMTPDHPLFDQF